MKKSIKGPEFITIVKTKDDYLTSASLGDHDIDYFNEYWSEHEPGEYLLENWWIPKIALNNFEAQGTSEQVYSDGYEAYEVLKKTGKLALKKY